MPDCLIVAVALFVYIGKQFTFIMKSATYRCMQKMSLYRNDRPLFL